MTTISSFSSPLLLRIHTPTLEPSCTGYVKTRFPLLGLYPGEKGIIDIRAVVIIMKKGNRGRDFHLNRPAVYGGKTHQPLDYFICILFVVSPLHLGTILVDITNSLESITRSPQGLLDDNIGDREAGICAVRGGAVHL